MAMPIYRHSSSWKSKGVTVISKAFCCEICSILHTIDRLGSPVVSSLKKEFCHSSTSLLSSPTKTESQLRNKRSGCTKQKTQRKEHPNNWRHVEEVRLGASREDLVSIFVCEEIGREVSSSGHGTILLRVSSIEPCPIFCDSELRILLSVVMVPGMELDHYPNYQYHRPFLTALIVERYCALSWQIVKWWYCLLPWLITK